MQTTKQIARSITNHNSPWSFVFEYIYSSTPPNFRACLMWKILPTYPTWHADHAAFALHVRSLDLLVFGLRYTFLTSSSMYFRKGFSIESRYNSVSKPTSFVILLTWLVLYFYSLTSVYYKSLSSINNIVHTCKAFETHSGL